jgi:hypothetical protein
MSDSSTDPSPPSPSVLPKEELPSADMDEVDIPTTHMDEFCQCIIWGGIGKFANCLVCGLKNFKYLQAVHSAATKVIAQHFTREYVELTKTKEHTGKFRKQPDCSECCRMKTPLVRRFGTAPKHFRKCLEDRILIHLINFAQYNPDQEEADRCAMDCVHCWMDEDVQMVTRRERIRRTDGSRTFQHDDVKDWF